MENAPLPPCRVEVGDSHALVDEADLALVVPYSWRIRSGYAIASTSRRHGTPPRRSFSMHRLILGLTDPLVQVDHVNANRLDNRRANIRIATTSQNHANRVKGDGTTNRFKGVSWDKYKKKWAAAIQVNGKTFHLGRFSLDSSAAIAYDEAAVHYFGEFSRVNFPSLAAPLPPEVVAVLEACGHGSSEAFYDARRAWIVAGRPGLPEKE